MKWKNASKELQSMGQLNMLCRKHPTNQPMRRQVTTLILSNSPHNNNKTKLQSNCFCIKDKIETWAKKAQKKNANQKDIKLLNSANEVAACLVEFVNTEHEKNFSTLAEMQEHMAEQAVSQTKEPADESSDDKEEDDK